MIFHIAHRSDWATALVSGAYRVSSRGRTIDDEGFVHASTVEQLSATAKRFYVDDPEELVVLTIDEQMIATSGVDLRFEPTPSGELFPHIYGEIRPSWVVETRNAHFEGGELVIGA